MNPTPRSDLLLSLALMLALIVGCVPQTPGAQAIPVVTSSPASQSTPANSPAASPASTKPHGTKQFQGSATRKPKPGQLSSSPSSSSIASATSNFNIILGRPTATSVTASLYSTSDMQLMLQYGTASGNYHSQTPLISLKASVPQDVELNSLAPDIDYHYQVVANGSASGEHTFHTQRASGDSFTFTIDADPHYSDPSFNGQLYEITMNNALASRPDFHINLGDTFMTEKQNPRSIADDVGAHVNMRSYLGILAADTPLFLVNGNHDGELGWLLSAQSEEPIWATQLRQLYYPDPFPNGFYTGASLPDPALGAIRDAYYSWIWGDALFIVLDPFWYSSSRPDPNDLNTNWNYTLGKERYGWLKSTLESSNAKYKFVFIHNLVGGSDKDSRGGIEAAPYFEWGGKNADGTYGFDQQRPGWGVPIHELLVQNHVSAVFHGHDHVFVKQELDGIVYQEVPQPSITKYDNAGLAAQYGYSHGVVLSSSGFLRVSVTPQQVTVDYIRSFLPKDVNTGQRSGEVAYTYHIRQ
jgi:hypothetical protein